jgi:NTP pyrophosphatase (non-canonical NTP hydrolase)
MSLHTFIPPYHFGPMTAIQAPRKLDVTLAAIERDPLVAKQMRINEADYAVNKVVEEALEFRDAYQSRRGMHQHDTQHAREEAGDLAMSLQMAMRNMGFSRWEVASAMSESAGRMAWRWPRVKALYQQVKDWPQSWRDVKQEVG